jgi:hypothetical protein
MNARQVIGLLLMALCLAGLVAWNLHPPEGEDTNLLGARWSPR